MQQCTVSAWTSTVVVRERRSSPQKAQQEAVPTGPAKGATGGKTKEFRLAGMELYDKKKGQLTSVQTDELLAATVL